MAQPPLPPFQDHRPSYPDGSGLSQFTWRHLSQLASCGTTCPLRVVAHIDMDAFYAQCEMIRLGVPRHLPLAVRQWNGLIAVNYPAREFGITRHCSMGDAKKLCPQLIAQHVATWREGDSKWDYHQDAPHNMDSHKVALDPYRLESRKIMALVKDCLPAGLQKVEKASIDEVFLDLSAHVHSVLLRRFPELAMHSLEGDASAGMMRLPMPPVSAVAFTGSHSDVGVGVGLGLGGDRDESESEPDDDDKDEEDTLVVVEPGDDVSSSSPPDWDDVCIAIGSQIVHAVRARILSRLGYTTSAGIAPNKMLSKLASAHRKPNAQTIIRPRAVPNFLSGKKITQVRMLGGKRGDTAAAAFNTDMVTGLLGVSLETMRARLGMDTGSLVYNMARGVDASEVNPRTALKSMLSAKAFNKTPLADRESALKWLRIFSADIHSRLVDEGATDSRQHQRRPRTLNFFFKHSGGGGGGGGGGGSGGSGLTRSRSCPIPLGKPIEERTLFELARSLLDGVLSEAGGGGARAWPGEHMSMSVTGFQEGVVGNMGIGSFLVRGEDTQALRCNGASTTRGNISSPTTTTPTTTMHDGGKEGGSAAKRRKVGGTAAVATGTGIQRFFSKQQSPMEDGGGPARKSSAGLGAAMLEGGGGSNNMAASSARRDSAAAPNFDDVWTKDEIPTEHLGTLTTTATTSPTDPSLHPVDDSTSPYTYTCPRCNTSLPPDEDIQSHQDWHLAVDLDQEERGRSEAAAEADLGPRRQQQSGGQAAAGMGKKSGPKGPSASSSSSSSRTRGGGGGGGRRGGSSGSKLERGQGTLKFG